MSATAKAALGRLAERIGPGIKDLSFRLTFADGGSVGLGQCEPEATEAADGGLRLTGRLGVLRFAWAFAPWAGGWWVTLDLEGDRALDCRRLESVVLRYDPGVAVDDWRVPTLGLHVEDAGLLRVGDLTARAEVGTLLRGAFPSADGVGLFVGTRIPQRCHQVHELRRAESPATALELVCATLPPEGLAAAERVSAEAVWLCAERTLAGALAVFAEHVPRRAEPAPPPTGWNSWDYYYSSVTAADVLENVDELAADPILATAIEYVVVDMGWSHGHGEWYPNRRFPEGTAGLARRIAKRGFVLGIWTAPLLVDPLSPFGLRGPDCFIKNRHGDPLRHGGDFLIDPTHPEGQVFLREVYRRLREEGYRFFKVDFVDGLLTAERFHDAGKGHFDALRDLFALIRDCVGDESHILGCSLPPGCGPGVVDSGRVGVDIHNQWSHVEWAFDYLQLSYWLHDRVWTNDVDFLVVRGGETSGERETTVRNPEARNPDPPKWRRGPVFATLDEARTWGDIVALSGGSLFLGDRLSKLNDAGLALIHRLVSPTGVAARPLDLGDGARASLWLQALPGERRLTVINWSEAPITRAVAISLAGDPVPCSIRDWWSGERVEVVDGACVVRLAPRESRVLSLR